MYLETNTLHLYSTYLFSHLILPTSLGGRRSQDTGSSDEVFPLMEFENKVSENEELLETDLCRNSPH